MAKMLQIIKVIHNALENFIKKEMLLKRNISDSVLLDVAKRSKSNSGIISLIQNLLTDLC